MARASGDRAKRQAVVRILADVAGHVREGADVATGLSWRDVEYLTGAQALEAAVNLFGELGRLMRSSISWTRRCAPRRRWGRAGGPSAVDDARLELKARILQALDDLDEPDSGLNLIGMAAIFRDATLRDIEAAVRELLSEGSVTYYRADDLGQDGPVAAIVRTEPGWAAGLLERINDLPEVL